MILGAMGDAHGGKHFQEAMVERLRGVDLLLLAGDIADSNDITGFDRVWRSIRNAYGGKIIAVFGNDEYEQDRAEYRAKFDAVFLDDEVVDIEVAGTRVRIVGTTGPLDRPTWWQRTHIPKVWTKYGERVTQLDALLERGDADLLVLLSHYAPTYLTLEGERPKAFPEMGSKAMERVLLDRRPDLVVHAHAHSGSRHALLREKQTTLDGPLGRAVPIWNVSLPLGGEISRLELIKDGGWNVRLQP
jgi:Icc-related predicted phosphoesterase